MDNADRNGGAVGRSRSLRRGGAATDGAASTSRRRRRPEEEEEDEEETPCLYPHFLCANDETIVRRVFEDVKDVIIRTAINSISNF